MQFVIYERPADRPDVKPHETRVYFDQQLAEAHVNENDDPELLRWMVSSPEADEAS